MREQQSVRPAAPRRMSRAHLLLFVAIYPSADSETLAERMTEAGQIGEAAVESHVGDSGSRIGLQSRRGRRESARQDVCRGSLSTVSKHHVDKTGTDPVPPRDGCSAEILILQILRDVLAHLSSPLHHGLATPRIRRHRPTHFSCIDHHALDIRQPKHFRI